jgi:hypothetical protein
MELAIAVMAHPPRPRPVSFEHGKHLRLPCTQCHTEAVSLRPDSTVIRCAGCHVEHHEYNRACAGCHATDQIVPAHRPPVEAHQECDACHTPERVAGLIPTRNLCLTCHTGQDHYLPKQCTVCHLQASPEVFQSHLKRAEPSR